MANKKVITNYDREPDKSLDNLGHTAYNSLNGNVNFTWTNGELETLKTRVDKFSTSLENNSIGGTLETTIKNVDRKEVLNILKVIGIQVNLQANGDLVKLLSSGLRLSKERTSQGQLPKPTGLKLVSGPNSGDLLCMVDAFENLAVYLFFWTAMPAPVNIDDWRKETSTIHKKTISGLTPGVQYAIRAAYQGSNQNLVYSDPIFIYAQ